MIGDELAGLLGPGEDPEFGFRQGVVVSFGLFDGTNQIDVGGTVLTDVPFLSPGSFVTLFPGEVVVLLRMKSSWAILGRVVVPGGTKAIGRYTELSATYSTTTATNFSLTTSYVTKTQLDITVPVWAETAAITCSLHLIAKNTTASTDFLNGKIIDPAGGSVTWPSASVPTLAYGQLTLVHHPNVVVTPGGTLTLLGQAKSTGGAWTADASNTAYIQATVAWNAGNG